MKWYFVAIFALVAMVAGFFIHPVIMPCDEVQAPTGLTVIKHSGPPDTVIVDHYVKEEVPVYVTKWKERIKKEIVVDTIYVEKEVPVFRSFEFFYDEYFTSEVYAWAKAPVDSFDNKVTIDYDRYFYDVYSSRIRKERNKYRLGDLAIGFGVGVGVVGLVAILAK